jgi:hypothetical protein
MPKPLPPPGPGPGRGHVKAGDQITGFSGPVRGSTSQDYLLSRLARDAPAHLPESQ